MFVTAAAVGGQWIGEAGERGNFSQDTATLLWSQAIMQQSVLEQEQGMFADIIRWYCFRLGRKTKAYLTLRTRKTGLWRNKNSDLLKKSSTYFLQDRG